MRSAESPASNSGTGGGFLMPVVLRGTCQSVLMAAIYFEMYQKNKKGGKIDRSVIKQEK